LLDEPLLSENKKKISNKNINSMNSMRSMNSMSSMNTIKNTGKFINYGNFSGRERKNRIINTNNTNNFIGNSSDLINSNAKFKLRGRLNNFFSSK